MKRTLFLIVGTLALALPGFLLAATPSSELSPALSPQPTPSPLSLPPATLNAHDIATVRSPLLAKLSRLFSSRDSTAYHQTSLKLANTYLVAALQAQAKGKTEQTEKLFTAYQAEIQRVQDFIIGQATSSNLPIQQLREQWLDDSVLQLNGIDSLAAHKAQADWQAKLTSQRAIILRKVTRLLEKEHSTAEIEKKLDRLSKQLSKKDTQASGQLQRRLAFFDDLSLQEGDEKLTEAIESTASQQIVEKAAELDETTLETVLERAVNESRSHRIQAISQALAKAPEAAKPALQRVLAKLQARALEQSIDEVREKADKARSETKKGETSQKTNGGSSKSKVEVTINGKKTVVESDGDGATSLNINEHGSASSSNQSSSSSSVSLSTDADSSSSSSVVTKSTNESRFSVIVTSSSCGANLTVSRNSQTRIDITNSTAHAIVYTVGSLGSKAVKANSKETLELTPTQTGTFQITCSGSQSPSTFHVQ